MLGIKANDRVIKALKSRQRDYEVSIREHRGLIVIVYPSGTKAFALRYRQDGILKRVRLSASTLATARIQWQHFRDKLKSGEDPAENVRIARVEEQRKRQAKRAEPTVKELAADYIELHAKKKKKSWRADELILTGKVIPEWGNLRAKEVTRRDVVLLLDTIAEDTPIYANRVLAVIRKMYNWAIEKSRLETSPCDHVKGPAVEKSRERVLKDSEIWQLWNLLDSTRMPTQTQIALKLQLVTGQRIGEIAGAVWSEFDFTNDCWLIPGKRTKNGIENLVPLSSLALELIGELEKTGPAMFPTQGRSGAKTLRVDVVTHQLLAAVKEMKMEHFTSHDLRRSAGTGLASLKAPRVVIDAILNHKDPTVGAVYDRYNYQDEKRAALEAWSQKILRIVTMKQKPASEHAVTTKPSSRFIRKPVGTGRFDHQSGK